MLSHFTAEKQLFITLLCFISLLPICCHALRYRLGLGALFAITGALTLLFWQMRLFGWWLNWDDWLVINTSSIIFIPALMIALVFCYAFDGIRAARSCWLILILTSFLAWGFTVFRAELSNYSPIPSVYSFPLSSNYALMIAIFSAAAFNLFIYEIFCRLSFLFALTITPLLSTFCFLLTQSTVEYGLEYGLQNFINDALEYGICGIAPTLLIFLYGLHCYFQRFFMPARPIAHIFMFWRKTESNLAHHDLLESRQIISESRQLNQQLSETQRLHDFHTNLNPQAIIHTLQNGKITSVNPAAEILFEQNADKLINLSIYLYVTNNTLAELAADNNDTLISFTNKNKDKLWHQYIVLPIYDAYKQHSAYQVIIKDVTQSQRKQLTEKIEHQVKNIHRTSKMFSHDISNLLLGMQGMLEQIKQAFKNRNETELDDGCSYILTALSQGRKMLYQMDNDQSMGTPRLEPCPLTELIDNAAKIASPAALSKQVTLNFFFSAKPTILVDNSQITRVITNLLVNAIKASSENNNIDIFLCADKDGFSIKVKDQGKGMSQDNIAHAFDPAFSTKGSGQGGLGLAISYLIIDAHGGHLELKSNHPESGIIAELWLPDISPPHNFKETRLLLALPDGRNVDYFATVLNELQLDWLETQNTEELNEIILSDKSLDILLITQSLLDNIDKQIIETLPCIISIAEDLSLTLIKGQSEIFEPLSTYVNANLRDTKECAEIM